VQRVEDWLWGDQEVAVTGLDPIGEDPERRGQIPSAPRPIKVEFVINRVTSGVVRSSLAMAEGGRPQARLRSRGSWWRRILVEPARPRWIASQPNARWYAVATVCVGAFMGQLDASIVIVALPSVGGAFHSPLGAVVWVGLAYLLTLVALVTAVGRLADMIGHKLLYTYGFVVFVVGSALCGLAPTLVSLDGFRVLQGIGAAMLQANSVAIIALAMPPEKIGRAMGIQGAAQGLGLAMGPAVGGLLIAAGGWRLIFYANVPVGIVATALAWFLIPRSRDLQERVGFDWLGLLLFVPAVAGLLYAVTFLGDQGGQVPAGILGLLAGCVVLGVAFVLWERRSKAPLVDLRLFRRGAFSVGVSSGLLAYLVMFGSLYLVTYYLRYGPAQLSSAAIGLQLTVMPVAFGVTAPLAGRAADRLGARPLTVAGMLACAASLALLGLSRPVGAALLLPLAALGVGLGLFTPPNNAGIMGAAPRTDAGVASGILNMTRGMGASMGQAFVALVLGLAAGSLRLPSQVAGGFGVSAVLLAAVALLAGGLAALRSGEPLEVRAPLRQE